MATKKAGAAKTDATASGAKTAAKTGPTASGAKKSAAKSETSRIKKAKKRIQEEASTLKSQATERARDYARQGKDRATSAIKDVSGAMDDAAKSVDDRFGSDYGEYARMAAGAVSSFAEKLEGKDVEDLLKDAEDLVRKSPVAAIGIAAVAGFAIARLIKAGLGEQSDA